jgi:hypothetical protein
MNGKRRDVIVSASMPAVYLLASSTDRFMRMAL